MTALVVRHLTQHQVHERVDELVSLYRAVYAEPPYHEGEQEVAAFTDRLRTESASPGFALVAAEDGPTLGGYAYGLTFGPDQWWGAADRQPPETLHRPKFAVMELVVDKAYRGRGIGGRLLTALLAGRPEPYATLCTNPAAVARQIYHHWGWQPVAHAYLPNIPTMDVLLLPLA